MDFYFVIFLDFNILSILGKTLSYVLPIIQLLKSNYLRAVRCLIVLPVQELASQVYEIVSRYCQNSGLKAALTSGAHSFEEEQKKLIYKSKYSILRCISFLLRLRI